MKTKMKDWHTMTCIAVASVLLHSASIMASTTETIYGTTCATPDDSVKVTTPPDSIINEKPPVEQAPQFPGGEKALQQYMAKNLRYPILAMDNGVQARIRVQFVVSKKGEIINPKVVRDNTKIMTDSEKEVYKALEKEAVRFVGAMPKWNPGTINGKPVDVKFSISVFFKLTYN